MQEIIRKYHFYSAHRLHTAPKGNKCLSFHGHTYFVEISVEVEDLPKESGVTIFFNNVDEILEPIIKYFDHAIILSKKDEKWRKIFVEDDEQKVYLMRNPTSVEFIILEIYSLIGYTSLEGRISEIKLKETTSGWIRRTFKTNHQKWKNKSL